MENEVLAATRLDVDQDGTEERPGYSAWFERVGNRAFKIVIRNMETGSYGEDLCVWLDGRFERSRNADLSREGCRRIDDAWPGLVQIPTGDGFVPDTGETAVIVPELPVEGETRLFVHWLTADGSKFVMAGNITGRTWIIALPEGNMTLLPGRIPQPWPLTLTGQSPMAAFRLPSAAVGRRRAVLVPGSGEKRVPP